MLSVSWHKWVGGEWESSFCMAASAFWVITVWCSTNHAEKKSIPGLFACAIAYIPETSKKMRESQSDAPSHTFWYIPLIWANFSKSHMYVPRELRHQPVRFSRVWRPMQWCMGQASARMKTGKWRFGRLVRKTFVKRRIWFETTTFLRKCFWNSCHLGKFCLKRITRPGKITHVRPESS